MQSFRAIKTGKKCKHLSNFPAVTLQALCKFIYKLKERWEEQERQEEKRIKYREEYLELRKTK
jgi:hypothetical protein